MQDAGMIATLTVQGFGFTPDKAVANLEKRCQRHAGWDSPTAVQVATGFNPYSTTRVHGYVATTTLTKEKA